MKWILDRFSYVQSLKSEIEELKQDIERYKLIKLRGDKNRELAPRFEKYNDFVANVIIPKDK